MLPLRSDGAKLSLWAVIVVGCLLGCWSPLSAIDPTIRYVSLDHGEAAPVHDYAYTPPADATPWGNEICVFPRISYQTIEGVGGAFNEMGGRALAALPPETQDQVLGHLFDRQSAGLSFCRVPVAASDFSISAYSYDETPADLAMLNFSIQRDRQYLIPYIQGALRHNPALVLFASPWSPPGWMKRSGQMIGTDRDGARLREEKAVLAAYALYLLKFVTAYAENGIRIDRLCIQNEADVAAPYPSCVVPPVAMAELIGRYVKPLFATRGSKTGIYAGTFRAISSLDLLEWIRLPGSRDADGVGVQYSPANVLMEARILRPRIRMIHTEGVSYDGQNSREQALARFHEIAQYINAGTTNYCYWNMILDETGKSGWGWKQNSLITIDRTAPVVRYNPDYNALYLCARVLRPGDARIACVSVNQADAISVRGPDGVIKIMVQNEADSEQAYALKAESKEARVRIPARALAAIEWSP